MPAYPDWSSSMQVCDRNKTDPAAFVWHKYLSIFYLLWSLRDIQIFLLDYKKLRAHLESLYFSFIFLWF